jgi:hypothetical protein
MVGIRQLGFSVGTFQPVGSFLSGTVESSVEIFSMLDGNRLVEALVS